jgi:hypothetical protein
VHSSINISARALAKALESNANLDALVLYYSMEDCLMIDIDGDKRSSNAVIMVPLVLL